MEVCTDIPGRIRIAGHWCAIYYKGQKRVCFSCNAEGHVSRKCPSKTVPSASAKVGASLRGPVPLSSDVNVGAATSIAPAGACISPAHPVLVNVVPTPGSLVDVHNLVALVVDHSDDYAHGVDPNWKQSASSQVLAQAGSADLGVGSFSPETSVLSPVPLRPAVLGAKRFGSRSCSASLSKSRLPLHKGSRAAVLSSDCASDDAHSDEYSLESEVVS
ncbi:---NA--- [Paramuricea clavata]|uniref:---NA n=1 Tax=Paramuricea clavata TaxID=317549 RepID=A0A7D9M2K1_PARCT|nr:---NA--- [Paramuricea clavata]